MPETKDTKMKIANDADKNKWKPLQQWPASERETAEQQNENY